MAAPTDFDAQAFSSSIIQLTWIDVDGGSDVVIYRSPDGVGDWVLLYVVDESEQEYFDEGLSPSTTYYYRADYDESGEFTSVVSATTEAAAYPTTAKPTATFNAWDNSGFGALLRCQWIGNATDFRDPVGNVLWEDHVPRIGGCGLGYPAQNLAEWSAGDVVNDYCLRFTAGSHAKRSPSRGWADAVTASVRSIACVFEPWVEAGVTNRTCPVYSNGIDNTIGYGIAVQVAASNGAITLGSHVGGTFNSSGITLARDKKYVVILTYTSGTGRAWQVYNWTDQVWVTVNGTPTTSTDSGTPSVSTLPDAVINACTSYDGVSVDAFVGRVYTAFHYDGDLRASTNGTIQGYVDALVADPMNAVRGAIASGGALVAAGITAGKNSPTLQGLISSRPTGGASTAYQFRWHRSTTPLPPSPDASTLITAFSSSPTHDDTTRAPGVRYYYKCEQTDGTSTVFSTTAASNSTQLVSLARRGECFFAIAGDSRTTTSTYNVTMQQAFASLGIAVGIINGGQSSTLIKSGTASASWQPPLTADPAGQSGTTLLPKAVARAVRSGVTTFYIEIGINDLATADSIATVGANLAVITNYLIGLGYTCILGIPFMRTDAEQTTADVESWTAYLRTLDNGTTIKVVRGQSLDASCYTHDANIKDKIHYNNAGSDGIATALDFVRRLDPGALGIRNHQIGN